MSENKNRPAKLDYQSSAASRVHGAAKKKGGGGKYTWGRAGIDDLTTVTILDKNDPNYVSDEDTATIKFEVVALDPQEEFKEGCGKCIKEYFDSEDIGEVAESLHELNEPVWHYEFVKQAITRGIDASDRERELVSQLISALYGTLLPTTQIQAAFRLLLKRSADMLLDSPNVATLLGSFLARAIVDDLLAPAFLKLPSLEYSTTAVEAIARAKALLSDGKKSAARVEEIWGAGSNHSVAKLKKGFNLLAREYLDGGGVEEADRCLRELSVPHFHFQFVKEVVYLALEVRETSKRDELAELLQAFSKSGLLSSRAISTGFQTCLDNVAELQKDFSPKADQILLDFISGRCASILSEEFTESAKTCIAERLAIEKERRLALLQQSPKAAKK